MAPLLLYTAATSGDVYPGMSQKVGARLADASPVFYSACKRGFPQGLLPRAPWVFPNVRRAHANTHTHTRLFMAKTREFTEIIGERLCG